MLLRAGVFVCVAMLILGPRQGDSADISGVRLEGGTGEYIRVGSSSRYTLICDYRAGYDDDVQKVVWRRNGQIVYEYYADSKWANVNKPLTGRVDRASSSPENIHFSQIDQEISGNYTCQVISVKGSSLSQPFFLPVIEVQPASYEIQVNLLRDVEEEDDDVTTEENENCTLVWRFQSPAIFPRPNVTCGYYSYTQDDIVQDVPAGMVMHQYPNESWKFMFRGSHIQVSDIPRLERLGCSIRIPHTSYHEVVKFEDGFMIDHLIDAPGCPNLDFNFTRRLRVELRRASFNCRGDISGISREEPAIAVVSCWPGTGARFSNGDVVHDWQADMQCSEDDHSWYHVSASEGRIRPEGPVSIKELPTCDPLLSGGRIDGANGILAISALSLSFSFL